VKKRLTRSRCRLGWWIGSVKRTMCLLDGSSDSAGMFFFLGGGIIRRSITYRENVRLALIPVQHSGGVASPTFPSLHWDFFFYVSRFLSPEGASIKGVVFIFGW